MKNFFYLLPALLLLMVTSCNNDLENITPQQSAKNSNSKDFASTAKANLQSTAHQEAYLNQQLASLDLTKEERSKASKNTSGSLLGLSAQAKSLNNLGNLLFLEQSYDIALFYYLNALQIKTTFNDKKGMAISYRNVALAYQAKGDYENAAINYWQSFYIWESLGNETRKGQLYNDLGIVYSLSHDFVETANFEVEQSSSLSYYEQAIVLNKATNDLGGIAQAEHNINVLYERWLGKGLSANAHEDLSYDQDDVEDEL